MAKAKNNQTRRQFLKKSATAAAALIVANEATALSFFDMPHRISPIDIPESDQFPLGVTCGDATLQRALLWTFYKGSYPLKLAVWSDSSTSEPLYWIDAKRSSGGFVHIDVSGLNAGDRYQYAFIEVDFASKPMSRSRMGHFRMPPLANALAPLTIGAVSCTFNMFEPTILEHAGARNDLDAFLCLGDTTYNDGAADVHDFRQKWAENLSKNGYLAVRSSTNIIATLDDHEVENNFDPETTDASTFRAAMQTFFEHQPIRRSEENPNRIWRKFRWGRTAEIFVLDCRTERLPSTQGLATAQYISREQMNWLKDGLSQSDAVFKVIMNSVPISEFPFFSDSDRWQGYPSQRAEILNFIDSAKIPGVLWVAGDFHFASVGKVSTEGPGKNQQEVLVGPGAQLPNYGCLPLNFNSQFEWASARNNYVTLHFDPYKMSVDLVYQGGSDDPRKTHLSEITEIYRTTLHLGKY